ncbi:MAG: hypothetical protein AAF533_11090 [Acidobacteriota bacterium]
MKRHDAEQQTEELLRALIESGVDFVVVGGVAAIAHGATRSTKDLDVVIPMVPDNLRRLLAALMPHAPVHLHRPDLGIIPQTPEELSAFRTLLISTALGRIDILREVDPIGEHDALETIELELVDGLACRVVSLDQLVEIKSHVGRPHDLSVEAELRKIRELRGSD